MEDPRMSKRIDLTQFEGMGDGKHLVRMNHGIRDKADRYYHAVNALPDLIAELTKTYKVIELLQGHYEDSDEDSERHAAFHKEGVCDFLMFDCQYCASK
jgi:hypothetical protein